MSPVSSIFHIELTVNSCPQLLLLELGLPCILWCLIEISQTNICEPHVGMFPIPYIPYILNSFCSFKPVSSNVLTNNISILTCSFFQVNHKSESFFTIPSQNVPFPHTKCKHEEQLRTWWKIQFLYPLFNFSVTIEGLSYLNYNYIEIINNYLLNEAR